MKTRFFHVLAALFLAFGISSCSLDYVNPNAAAENQVLTTREGLFTLAVGMQQFYATSSVEAYITRTGVTTRELGVTTTFQNPLDLELGGAELPTESGDVLAIWQRSYRVIGMADNILANAPNTSILMPAGSRSGLIALASLYKAMSLGHLAMYFEQAPLRVGTPSAGATYRPRAEVLTEVIRLLDNAAQQIATNAPDPNFTTTVIAGGFNLSNTIQAMRARFLLMAGRNADAIVAANAVNTAAAGLSVFRYDAQLNRNPIFLSIIQGNNYAPRDLFGTPVFTDTSDARLRFFMRANTRRGTPPAAFNVDDLAATFFASADAATPVFRMGEMALIRAEAQARQNNLTAAVTEINAIRTKRATADPHGIGANLPAYSGAMTQDAILTEIYAQRCVELFLTGMRMEDQRRFGRPAPPSPSSFQSERNRNFYPYPSLERDNNPANTPANPPI
ncbi:MAG: RagB/SusD family nutrient uptake outer membrane protein [Ignavibacteria bacterium]|nr:RagB/SusD family nutrient uptake outer membrane protein [Ignavibacteria bacterium]